MSEHFPLILIIKEERPIDGIFINQTCTFSRPCMRDLMLFIKISNDAIQIISPEIHKRLAYSKTTTEKRMRTSLNRSTSTERI